MISSRVIQQSCGFQKEEKSAKCEKGTRFLCPVQHVCVGAKCLACGKPSCVEAEEKVANNMLIKAANSTDQKEADDMCVSYHTINPDWHQAGKNDSQLCNSREKVQKEQQDVEAKEAKTKGWRTLRTEKKKNEGKVDVGISV